MTHPQRVELPVGHALDDQYVVDGPALGEGGFGTVYPCIFNGGERRAVKVLQPGQHELSERMEKEAKLQQRLYEKGIPGVLPVYDVGRTRIDGVEVPFFSMKLIDDARHLDAEHWPYETRVRLLAETLRTIHTMHEDDVQHRDLKPHNVLVDGLMHAYLTDFGIAGRAANARRAATHATQLGGVTTIIGIHTENYAPPEQVDGIRDLLEKPQVDVFAAGYMTFELLTDEAPYPDDASAFAASQKRRGRAVTERMRPFVPPEGAIQLDEEPRVRAGLETALQHALELDWERRADSLRELIRALELYQRALSQTARQQSIADLIAIQKVHDAFGEGQADDGVGVEGGAEPPSLRAWQVEALDAWDANDGRGIIEACTGSGKTRVALEAIGRHLDARRGHNALVIVPTLPLVRQWKQAVETLLPNAGVGEFTGRARDSFVKARVLITTPHSLERLVRQEKRVKGGTLLIADECHHYGGVITEWDRFGSPTLRLGYWAQTVLDLPCEKRMGLSATVERSDEGHETILPWSIGKVVYQYALADALRDGVIAKFRVAFVRCPLDEDARTRLQELSGELGQLKRQLVDAASMPAGTFADFMRSVSQRAKDGDWRARAYLKKNNERLELLAEVGSKYDALQDLEPLMRETRSLVFAQRARAARRAYERLDAAGLRVGYIDKDVRARSTIFRRFSANTAMPNRMQVIISPQVLDEGVDVPKATLGVVVMGSSSRRQMIQRIGRVVRKRAGKVAKFVVLVAAGTSEDPSGDCKHEDFIDEVLDAVGPECWRVFDVDQADTYRDWLNGGDAHGRVVVGGEPAASGSGASGQIVSRQAAGGSSPQPVLEEAFLQQRLEQLLLLLSKKTLWRLMLGTGASARINASKETLLRRAAEEGLGPRIALQRLESAELKLLLRALHPSALVSGPEDVLRQRVLRLVESDLRAGTAPGKISWERFLEAYEQALTRDRLLTVARDIGADEVAASWTKGQIIDVLGSYSRNQLLMHLGPPFLRPIAQRLGFPTDIAVPALLKMFVANVEEPLP